MSGLIGRSAEFTRIAAFLAAPQSWPAELIVEGEAGIGKSTLWLAGLEDAREKGMHVLSALACEARTVPPLRTVLDLLSGVDAEVLAELPEPQRAAVADPGAARPQMLAAALLSIAETLARTAPVLLAIDDLHWVDPASQAVVAFVARRLRGPMALLATWRTEADVRWLQTAAPGGSARVLMRPLSLGGLHELLTRRLGRSYPRPSIVRIAEISGGNPFYALELARALDGRSPVRGEVDLPSSLADVVRARIGELSGDVGDALLVAASASDPTVEMIAQATGFSVDRTVELLEGGGGEVVSLAGNRVRFSHPLLAHGVYAEAPPPQRRRVHQMLAGIVTEPELRARHLALAATGPDPVTVQVLDEGAAAARAKGAPAEAAELLDLSIALGGDAPRRRIAAADNHIRAGDTVRALEILDTAIAQLPPGPDRAIARAIRAGARMNTDGYPTAVEELQLALSDAADDVLCTARVRILLAFAQVHADQFAVARESARRAESEAELAGRRQLISVAVAVRVLVEFLCGSGVDSAALNRALALEAVDSHTPIALRASAVHAVILTWTGDLDRAGEQMRSLAGRVLDNAADAEIAWVSMSSAVLALLRGRYDEAAHHAQDTVERAERLGGSHAASVGLALRGGVAAYRGDLEAARRDLNAALDSARSCASPIRYVASAMLASAEVSAGAHREALAAVTPMLRMHDTVPGVEFPTKAYLPEAIEALVAEGRLDEAAPLVDAVEEHGRRHDRPWLLSAGARCRALLLAAGGQVATAEQAAVRAMSEYDRLPMPFEKARTQLVLGQLQRRQRRRWAAVATLHEALDTFDRLGARVWSERARAELGRTNVAAGDRDELSPSERRIAELAASGMTNREVAAALFVSAKTVEANLTQVYRKLGIRSRAELGRSMGDSPSR